jgi:hypothetical protein
MRREQLRDSMRGRIASLGIDAALKPLFDLYTGPQIGEGKKSLAYALRFRAPDRALIERHVDHLANSNHALGCHRGGQLGISPADLRDR